MKIKKRLFLFILLPLMAFNNHKYYLSLTDIEYNQETKSYQIIINVFMDDIELALNKDYNIDLRLTSKNELKNASFYFHKYLREKLTFKSGNKNLNFNYLGNEYEGDLVFFYLEIENINSPDHLEVTNKILTEHFADQKNVVKLKVGKKRRSKILTKKNDKALLKF